MKGVGVNTFQQVLSRRTLELCMPDRILYRPKKLRYLNNFCTIELEAG